MLIIKHLKILNTTKCQYNMSVKYFKNIAQK